MEPIAKWYEAKKNLLFRLALDGLRRLRTVPFLRRSTCLDQYLLILLRISSLYDSITQTVGDFLSNFYWFCEDQMAWLRPNFQIGVLEPGITAGVFWVALSSWIAIVCACATLLRNTVGTRRSQSTQLTLSRNKRPPACGWKKGGVNLCLALTKLHENGTARGDRYDGAVRLIRFFMTAGQVSDRALVSDLTATACLLGDRGYDAD